MSRLPRFLLSILVAVVLLVPLTSAGATGPIRPHTARPAPMFAPSPPAAPSNVQPTYRTPRLHRDSIVSRAFTQQLLVTDLNQNVFIPNTSTDYVVNIGLYGTIDYSQYNDQTMAYFEVVVGDPSTGNAEIGFIRTVVGVRWYFYYQGGVTCNAGKAWMFDPNTGHAVACIMNYGDMPLMTFQNQIPAVELVDDIGTSFWDVNIYDDDGAQHTVGTMDTGPNQFYTTAPRLVGEVDWKDPTNPNQPLNATFEDPQYIPAGQSQFILWPGKGLNFDETGNFFYTDSTNHVTFCDSTNPTAAQYALIWVGKPLGDPRWWELQSQPFSLPSLANCVINGMW